LSAATSPYFLLLRHEMRLYLRTGFLRASSLTFLIISQVLLHLIALAFTFIPAAAPGDAAAREGRLLMLASAMIGMLVFMVSRSLANAVQALYTRGDLDLLLASPVDRRALIGVRTGAIALSTGLEVAALVWPFANVFVLCGRLQWLKAYLLVPGMAMLATSIALVVTLAAFRTIGPRRTRITVQVLAVIVGFGFTLVAYLPMLAGRRQGPAPVSARMEVLAHQSAGFREIVVAPAQWLMAGYLPVIVFLIASATLFAFTIHMTGDRVVRALTTIAGSGTRVARRAGAAAMRFRRSFRSVVVLKELRLIARDPFLVAQILQQSLVALPAAMVLWRTKFGGDLPLAWLSVILLGATIAGALAWLTIVAEDAPDLLAAAPVSRAALIRAKLEAAMLPALPICLLPLPFLLSTHPWYAVCLTLCATGSALTSAMLNMRNPVARRRDSFKTRHRQGGFHGLLALLLVALWMALCLGLTWLGRLPGGG
jgi:ABC-2 type transport system permease protein